MCKFTNKNYDLKRSLTSNVTLTIGKSSVVNVTAVTGGLLNSLGAALKIMNIMVNTN